MRLFIYSYIIQSNSKTFKEKKQLRNEVRLDQKNQIKHHSKQFLLSYGAPSLGEFWAGEK